MHGRSPGPAQACFLGGWPGPVDLEVADGSGGGSGDGARASFGLDGQGVLGDVDGDGPARPCAGKGKLGDVE
jgi:hypothetical protein